MDTIFENIKIAIFKGKRLEKPSTRMSGGFQYQILSLCSLGALSQKRIGQK